MIPLHLFIVAAKEVLWTRGTKQVTSILLCYFVNLEVKKRLFVITHFPSISINQGMLMRCKAQKHLSFSTRLLEEL